MLDWFAAVVLLMPAAAEAVLLVLAAGAVFGVLAVWCAGLPLVLAGVLVLCWPTGLLPLVLPPKARVAASVPGLALLVGAGSCAAPGPVVLAAGVCRASAAAFPLMLLLLLLLLMLLLPLPAWHAECLGAAGWPMVRSPPACCSFS
jgi:hypothetical protein